MGLMIEITVTSTNHTAGTLPLTDGGVRLAQEYDGADGNGRYDADVVLYRGSRMLTSVAHQLAKLAELDGGPLFTDEHRAQTLGRDGTSVR